MNALEKRKVLFDTVITPFFKQHGFKKKRYDFYLDDGIDVKIVETRMNKFNTADFVDFEFSVGFYHPAVHRFFAPKLEKLKPSTGFLSFDLYMLLYQTIEVLPYKIETMQDMEPLRLLILKDLNKLMELFTSLKSPMNYLNLIPLRKSESLMIQIHCLFLLLQQKDIKNAKQVFHNLYTNFTGHPEVKEDLRKAGIENHLLDE